MKTWIKRTLVGVFGATVLFGGLAACSHRAAGGWGDQASDEQRAQWHARMVDRAAGRLDLDSAQRARLDTLAQTAAKQHKALRGATDPHDDLRALVAGDRFDRQKAQALVDGKTQALRQASPELIQAAADFYDSLRPEQQLKVREFMQRKGRRHGWHG
jgi:periplasmic protein CpxP/Spy